MLRQYASLLGAAAASLAVVYILRVRHAHRPRIRPGVSDASLRLLQLGRRRLLTKMLDVGGFFGVDVGGSLCKLVFFLPEPDLVQRILDRAPPVSTCCVPALLLATFRLQELRAPWARKMESIKQIADFVLARETYGLTGVRDADLSFHMAELGGTFHFIRSAAIFTACTTFLCQLVPACVLPGLRRGAWRALSDSPRPTVSTTAWNTYAAPAAAPLG